MYLLLLIFACFLSVASAAPFLFVTGYGTIINVFDVDIANGNLKPVVSVSSNSVSWLSWLPSAKFIYGANENVNKLTAFRFNPDNGNMAVIGEVLAGGQTPVSLWNDDRFLFAAEYSSGQLAIFDIDPATGDVGKRILLEDVGVKAHQVKLMGDFVFVPCLGSDYIAQYVFDFESKTLTPNKAAAHVLLKAGSGPRHLAFHPNKEFAYLISETASTVSLLRFDARLGILQFVEAYSTLWPDFKGVSFGGEVLISNDGRFLYASNRGNDTIAIFSVDLQDGRLKLRHVESGDNEIKYPRSFAIDPTGKLMVVANQKGNSTTLFHVNAEDGMLDLIRSERGFDTPAFVAFYGN